MAALVAVRRVVRPGSVLILGDNPHSVDSRPIGYVRYDTVLGTVVRRMTA